MLTDLFTRLAALQGDLPETPHTYKPLTAGQYEALESQVYRMGPQIDGTPAWPPESMLEWLQQQTPHVRGVAIAMMRRAYRPERVGLPPLPCAVAGRQTAPKPFSAKDTRPMATVLSADGRPAGKHHMVDGLTPVAIDCFGNIRCAITGRTLWIAPGSIADRVNPDAAKQLNPTYQPSLHQVVADHRQNTTSGE